MKKRFFILLPAAFCLGLVPCVLSGCASEDLKNAEIILSESYFVYDGTAHCPDVIVKFGDKEVDSEQFSIAYRNNTNAGEATVIVTPAPQSDYKNTKTETFVIQQAEVAFPAEKYLTAEYNQTLGEILGTRYSITASDDGYTENTRLTSIGENTYSFTALYTPENTNYKPALQTIHISVEQATPSAVELIKGTHYTAYVGDYFADLEERLPAGVRIVQKERRFETAGNAFVEVAIDEIVNGKVDNIHYKTATGVKLNVEVQKKEIEIGEMLYTYDAVGFKKNGNGTYSVNGNVSLESSFSSCQDWTVSITFSGTLSLFELYTVFDNVVSPDAEDIKMNSFDFENQKITSWLGLADANYEGTDADKVALPDCSSWTGYKITIVSRIETVSSITRRNYFIYFGDAASDELGTRIFYRHTPRKNAYRFRYVFSDAQNVTVSNVTFSETPYVHKKLLADKFLPYLEQNGATVKQSYTDGGILMVGDSLIDYWGMDFDTDRSVKAGADTSREVFHANGFNGPVINLGIGSSSTEDWLNYLQAEKSKRLFEQLHPDVVFMLIGCNQITHEDEKNISDTVIELIERFSMLYPQAKILVNSMMPTTTKNSRWSYWNRLANANERIANYISEHERLYFLDTQNLFTPNRNAKVSASNSPISTYHAKDGLHFKTAAYELWTKEVFGCITKNHLIPAKEVAITVRDTNGNNLENVVEVVCTLYNDTLRLTVLIADKPYQVASILLNGTDITSRFDSATCTLSAKVADLVKEQQATLTITLKYAEEKDDNVIDDGNFQ